MWLTLFLSAALATASNRGDQIVSISRLPAGDVQPAAVMMPGGTLRVVCLAGDPKAADVVLLERGPGQADFDPPERVNSTPGAAVAMGTIRGARAAAGTGGRLHVIWNGSKSAGDQLNTEGPLVYTRSDRTTGAFEPERDLMGQTTALDGGAAIVADGKGTVLVAWHAVGPGSTADEAHRNIFVRRSTDDGATFEPPVAVLDTAGVCACCSIAATVSPDGNPLLLYRSARSLTDRDMNLVTLPRAMDRIRPALGAQQLDRWSVRSCPMSSCGFAAGPDPAFAAWETQGQVHAARLRPDGTTDRPLTPAGAANNRKHPRVSMNARGELLLVWTEGTAWGKGGSIAWQVYTPNGEPVEQGAGTAEGLPAWGFAEPVTTSGERFEILY
jgi:hypothetical protein